MSDIAGTKRYILVASQTGLMAGRLPTQVVECTVAPLAEGRVPDDYNIELEVNGELITMPRSHVNETFQDAVMRGTKLYDTLINELCNTRSVFDVAVTAERGPASGA